MLRLYVMRHAKSSWAVPGARDFDRELNERGRLDLEKLSRAISAKQYTPELILCSSATRTRETYEGIAGAFAEPPEVSFTEKLYSSGLDDYMRTIHSVTDARSLMLIGHNPMCGALAASLAVSGDDEHLELIGYKYPTGTISVLDIEIEAWSELKPQSAFLADCLVPSAL